MLILRDLLTIPIGQVVIRHYEDRERPVTETRSDVYITMFTEEGLDYFFDILEMEVIIDKNKGMIYLTDNPNVSIQQVRSFWDTLTMFGGFRWNFGKAMNVKKKPFHPNAIVHSQFFEFTYELVEKPSDTLKK